MTEKDLPEEIKEVSPPEAESKTEKKKRKKILASAAAGITALSLMVGSIFSAPAEIIKPPTSDQERPAVIVQYEAQTDTEDALADEEDEEDKKKGLKASIKRFIQSLPLAARLFFILPLWIIGYGLIAIFTALFEPVIAPVLSVLIKWLLVGGLFAGAFFLLKKTIAPDTPITKIFSKRNIILILSGAAVFGTGDYFAMEYVSHYEFWRNIVCMGGGVLLLAVFALRMLSSRKKARALS